MKYVIRYDQVGTMQPGCEHTRSDAHCIEGYDMDSHEPDATCVNFFCNQTEHFEVLDPSFVLRAVEYYALHQEDSEARASL